VWLRLAPEQVVRVMRVALGWLDGRVTTSVESLIRRMAEGLGSLQGGSHLWWIAWHSVVIWTVRHRAVLVAMRALGIDLDRSAPCGGFVTLTAVDRRLCPRRSGFRSLSPGGSRALRRFGVGGVVPGARTPARRLLAHHHGVGLAVLRSRGARLEEATPLPPTPIKFLPGP
jgi:hypothetical protein